MTPWRQILERLFVKLKRMKEQLGSDRALTLSAMFSGQSLKDLIMDAISNRRSMEEILAEMELTPMKRPCARSKSQYEALATPY